MSVVPGELLAPGRSADVYVSGEDRVLKVFHTDWPEEAIDHEVRDAALVHELGLSPLRCYGRVDVELAGQPRRALELDRLHGIALTTVAERNILRLPHVGRTLGREHAAMHRVAAPSLPDVRDVAVDLLETPALAALSATERTAVADHLRALPGADTVLHLDYHPLNVFTHGDGRAVIDWQSTARGPAAADVAMTRLLFSDAELFPGIGRLRYAVYSTVRSIMGRYYLTEYRSITGMTDAEIDRWDVAARVLRLGLLDIASEREVMLAGIRAGLGAGSGAGSEAGEAGGS